MPAPKLERRACIDHDRVRMSGYLPWQLVGRHQSPAKRRVLIASAPACRGQQQETSDDETELIRDEAMKAILP
jgi:hypothetical protein